LKRIGGVGRVAHQKAGHLGPQPVYEYRPLTENFWSSIGHDEVVQFEHEAGLAARDGSTDAVIVPIVFDAVEISGGQLAGLVADLCEYGRVIVQCQNDSHQLARAFDELVRRVVVTVHEHPITGLGVQGRHADKHLVYGWHRADGRTRVVFQKGVVNNGRTPQRIYGIFYGGFLDVLGPCVVGRGFPVALVVVSKDGHFIGLWYFALDEHIIIW